MKRVVLERVWRGILVERLAISRKVGLVFMKIRMVLLEGNTFVFVILLLFGMW
jgi:hypothetical protein